MPNLKLTVVIMVLLLIISAPVFAQQNPDLSSPNIVINLPSRTLELYSGSHLVKTYPVAIGKPSTPTPLGSFAVINKEVDPVWYPPKGGEPVPSGPDNPLGYRWMGFLPMYGMHGTNAPWAIGMAVSNGCVRMQEEDAEELFEVVPYGTPVRVTYDRTKVRVDDAGVVSVGIYPDVYGYREVTIGEIKSQLEALGASGLVSDDYLARLITEEADRQIDIARLTLLKVNDKVLPDRAIVQNDIVYVPVWPVANTVGMDIVWDENSGRVKGPTRTVNGLVKGDILYVTANDLQMLFGGQVVWMPETNMLEYNVLTLVINGKPATADVQVLDGVLSVPVGLLSERLGKSVEWNPVTKTVMLSGRILPTGMIGDRSYIQITRISECFGAFVFWNQTARIIEITYPSPVRGND